MTTFSLAVQYLKVQHFPAHDVHDGGAAKLSALCQAPIGVDVPVQQQLRSHTGGETEEARKPSVSGIVSVADAQGGRVSREDVDRAPVPQSFSADSQFQSHSPCAHLSLSVLIRSLSVTDRTAEPGYSKTPGVDHPTVDVHASERPGPLPAERADQEGPAEVLCAQGLGFGPEIGVVIPGNEQQRHVEHGHEILEIVEGQVAAGNDQIGLEPPYPLEIERFVHFVGDG